MQFITLTTDFGIVDPYVGIIKGVISNIYPYAKIVDISHSIAPQNIWHANWVLGLSCQYFPKGTIHICIVDPGVGSSRKALLIETKNHFFIGPDNGLFTLALEKEDIVNVVELTERKYWLPHNTSRTFHGRDIFSSVAAHLAKGEKAENFGNIVNKEDLIKLDINTPINNGKVCTGQIQYIDHFGNMISNIPESFVPQKIHGKIKGMEFKGLQLSYADSEPSKLFGIIGSHGFLEFFINKGNSAKVTGSRVGDKFEVKF